MLCVNGHENPDGQEFCGACGSELASGLSAPSPPEPATPTGKTPAILIVAYVALGAAFLGSFLPWARVLFVTVNGTDGDGNITAVASAGAAIVLAVTMRQQPARRLALLAALGLSVVCAGTYLYDGNRLTSKLGGDTDGGLFGEIQVQPQLGLYLGTLGAILAVQTTALMAARSYRPHVLSEVPTGTLVALSAAAYAVSLAVVPGWWGLTITAALVAVGLGYMQRRNASNASQITKPATLALGAGVIGLLGGIGGAVIDDNGGSNFASCSDVFADGAITESAWEDDGVTCEKDGSRTFVLTFSAFCFNDDEAPLTNNFGWGFVGKPWHAGDDRPEC